MFTFFKWPDQVASIFLYKQLLLTSSAKKKKKELCLTNAPFLSSKYDIFLHITQWNHDHECYGGYCYTSPTTQLYTWTFPVHILFLKHNGTSLFILPSWYTPYRASIRTNLVTDQVQLLVSWFLNYAMVENVKGTKASVITNQLLQLLLVHDKRKSFLAWSVITNLK